MKKLIFVLFFMVFLIGIVGAVEWNDKLTYSKNDLKVSWDNWWGLGKTIGTAELKSHQSVDEVLDVGIGTNKPTMYYDFNFTDKYQNGLGSVEFTDMKTGNVVDKDYHFAYLGDVFKEDYQRTCQQIMDKNGSYYETCENNLVGNHTEKEWIKLETNGIPKGVTRIALITDMPKNSWFDAVWTIVGKKVDKHAQFSSFLKDSLVSCWTLDETSGVVIDSGLGQQNNGTNNNGTAGIPSPTASLGTGYFFPSGLDNNISIPDSASLNFTSNFTIGFYYNTSDSSNAIGGKGTFSGNLGYGFGLVAPNSFWEVEQTGSVFSSVNTLPSTASGDLVQVLLVYRAGQNVEIFVNGTSVGTSTTNIGASAVPFPGDFFIGSHPSGDVGDKYIYEVFALNYSVNSTDASDIYNSGDIISCAAVTTPSVTLVSPEDNFNSTNQTVTFNVTATDNEGILNVTLFIDEIANETNTSAFNGTYLFTKNLAVGDHNWSVLAYNDIIQTNQSETRNFSIKVSIVNDNFWNTTTFETANESFISNVTTNGTEISNSWLYYNGTTTAGSVENTAGDDFNLTASINIPEGEGNNSWAFNYTIGGVNFSSDLNEQNVSATVFALCNATVTVPYINISFRNETISEEPVNSIISSTWIYSLSTLSEINKTLTFSNATENANYTFCFSASNRSVNIDLSMTYSNSESQQRSFALTTSLSNLTLEQVLFLLPTSLGLFSPFQVITTTGDAIADVKAVITRILNGITINVNTGFTDDSGFITFFLNPEATYTGVFSKTGFDSETFSFVPTADTRTVTLGGGQGEISNGTIISTNTTYQITPTNTTLINDTVHTFGFNVTSGQTITFISMNITNQDGISYLVENNSGVGNLSGTLNTSSNKSFIGYYTIETAEETISLTRVWIVGDFFVGSYSIFRQFDLFLIYEFSDFIRMLIILVSIVGIMIFVSGKIIVGTNVGRIATVVLFIWGFSVVGWLNTGIVVNSGSSAIQSLGQFSNQFGIAIVTTGAGVYFILRRIFT